MLIQSIRFKQLSTLALGAAFCASSLGCSAAERSGSGAEGLVESDEPALASSIEDGDELGLGQLEQALLCAVGVVIGPINEFGGSPGSDVVTGTTQIDTLAGAGCDDVISAAGGDDVLSGGGGDDTLNGGGGDDVLTGGAGDDTLQGSINDDVLFGGAGEDTLDGGGDVGNDILVAGCDGDVDTMLAGPGTQDVCIGEQFIDVFTDCETIVFCP